MASLYLTLLIGGVLLLLVRALWRPARIFEYPYFIAAVFAVFILPQGVSLVHFPGRVSESAVEDVLLMCCLCLGSAAAGYQIAPASSLVRRTAQPVHEGRLFQFGVLFILCGFVFSYLLGRVEIKTERGGFTGLATILFFFAQLAFPGFAIALNLLLRKFTPARLLATIAGAYPIVMSVLVMARRENAVTLGLTILLGLYFSKRMVPSRWLILGSAVFAMLAIPATGIYRGLVEQGGFEKVKDIPLIDNFKTYFSRDSILELRNGAAMIQSVKSFDGYEYGAGYWNQIVFRFVPAQIIGKERKDALLIGTTVEKMFLDDTKFGHVFSTGTTLTGMGDSFKQFGWFGCLFFALIAVIFRSIWVAAQHPHALFAQLLYILICTSAMRAVTHQTVDFLPGFIYQFSFLSIGLWYAGLRKGEVATLSQPVASQAPTHPYRGSRPPGSRPRSF